MEDISVRIKNSFMPMEFMVPKMDVCHKILLILRRPLLRTTRALIDVAARIIKVNINMKEETSTFKPKGTEKCNQVMVMIRPERNAMTPDKKPSATENFSTKFSQCSRMPPSCDKISSRTDELIFKGMETILLAKYKREALIKR
jgi:hypothetical protein